MPIRDANTPTKFILKTWHNIQYFYANTSTEIYRHIFQNPFPLAWVYVMLVPSFQILLKFHSTKYWKKLLYRDLLCVAKGCFISNNRNVWSSTCNCVLIAWVCFTTPRNLCCNSLQYTNVWDLNLQVYRNSHIKYGWVSKLITSYPGPHTYTLNTNKPPWFKHILFTRKGLGTAYNATMPSPP